MFTTSTSPDVSESLPFLLSAAAETRRLASEDGVSFDCIVGGIGFRFGINDQHPYRRQTAGAQKQQFDTSREAGEQTLSQYWIRSQTSWHLGAGLTNYEPGSDPTTVNRFADSLGVDVWTEGVATLLRRASRAYSTNGIAHATGAVVNGADVAFLNVGGVVQRDATPYSGTTAALSPVEVAGTKILVGTAATIMAGSATGSTLTDLWTGAPSAPRPYWVKSRIVASAGANLYELTLTGGAFPATPLYAHPDTGWTWTSVVDAPQAILAAGRSGGRSTIFRFALEDATSGSTPKLSQAYEVANFPPGEEVLSLYVYLGRYVGIGTTRGLRVGVLSDAGDIQYGPLLFDSPVVALTARDRFLYGAVSKAHPDGGSGAVRVDLSQQIGDNTLRFPYAWDMRTGTKGTVSSIGILGVSDRVMVGVAGEGVYLQSATELEKDGWLDTGRVRFATVEPKSFQTLDITANIPAGAITVTTILKNDSFFLARMSPETPGGMGVQIARPSGTFEYLSFRFTFSSEPTGGPTLDSYQIKALPTPRRQRLIQMPLLCFDSERDRVGTPYGYEGYAWARLSALEEAQDFDAVVRVTDNTNDETFMALVEQITFTSATPDDPDKSKQGYVELILRKL